MKTADLLIKLQHLADIDPATVTDRELFNTVVEFEELMSSVAAKAMPLRAAVINRKATNPRNTVQQPPALPTKPDCLPARAVPASTSQPYS